MDRLFIPLKGRYKAIREGLYESLSLDAPPDPKKMDAQTIEDLVSPRKAVEPGPVEGEEEFEQLMREAGLESDDIEVIDPKTGKSEISQRMTLHTTMLVVLREDDIKDPPNQRTFQHFFGGGPPKRLEREQSVKPC